MIQASNLIFGYVSQHFSLYEELSVWENLKFYVGMYHVTDERPLFSLCDYFKSSIPKRVATSS